MKDPTRGPIFACLYPGLCDVARKHGYALAIHGTLVSDMDLIAVPWTDESVDALTLRNALMKHIGAVGYEDLLKRDSPWLTDDQREHIMGQYPSDGPDESVLKPLGRIAWNLYLTAGTKVDLSVMPRAEYCNNRSRENIQ